MEEAKLTQTETGCDPEGDGWFIRNLDEVTWERLPDNGTWHVFGAADAPFTQFALGPHILMPGEANGMYHAESSEQEGFLVLAGECVAVVEGEERRMRQWDYLHCPPGTHHITIGAGDGPCAILMIGGRSAENTVTYPVDPVAARHGASVKQETNDPKEAYADRRGPVTRVPSPWPI
jgi:uncharacterized cupin superfamily protein